MNGQIQYGADHPLTSQATGGAPPHGADAAPTRAELARRLGRFRHELRALGQRPTRHDLNRALGMAKELGLSDDALQNELVDIRVSLEAIEFQDYVLRSGLPDMPSLAPLPAGERCHHLLPVRFGRRRADQFGHLEMTSGWVRFHGSTDVRIAWTEVALVERSGREIVISVRDSRRLLRFGCHTLAEAARAAVIAQYLVTHIAV